MRQVLFTIPLPNGHGLPVFGYGLMLFIAFLAAMNLAAWRARREKLDPELIYDLALWVFIGGLVGARLFYVIQYWGVRVHSVWDVFRVWEGGIVLYGSIMGGTATFFLYWWLRRFPLRPTLDVFAPSLALGIAIGRLGCFLNGCCYGDPCDLPWAVTFPAGSPAWSQQLDRGLLDAPEGPRPWMEHAGRRVSARSLPVHPTQVYSAIDGFVLLGFLSAFYPLRRRDGEVMALAMMAYPVSRFLIEHLRNDEGVFVAGMTISQSISIGLLACGLAYWAYLSRLPRGRWADGDGVEPAAAEPAAAGAA